MNVWECDLLDLQSLAKYNDTHRYILSVIDVFSKYLHLVPVKTKSGPSGPHFTTITRAALFGFVETRAKNF